MCQAWFWMKGTNHFLAGVEDAHLAKADVEGWGKVGAIFLLDDDNVDGAGEGGWVNLIVETLKVRQ